MYTRINKTDAKDSADWKEWTWRVSDWDSLDWQKIDGLLGIRLNVNAKNKDGESVLHQVVKKGHPEAIQLLINSGANVSAQDRYGRRPLHFAAENGNLEAVQALIKNGANIKLIDKFGRTALHFAAHNGHGEVVKKLIEVGADVNVKNKDKQTPLHEARRSSVIKKLLEAGADIEGDSSNSSDEPTPSPLCCAAKDGNLEAVQTLIENGANINYKAFSGMTPLHFATLDSGHETVVKALIKAGADVNSQTVFYNDTPLHFAADDSETVKILIELGANVNAQNKDGKTPLHKSKSPESIKHLLDAGADVNAKENKSGKTALHLAAKGGYSEVVKKLIEAGAKINERDTSGKIPLSYAAYNGHTETVKVLIERGSNIADGKYGNLRLSARYEIQELFRNAAKIRATYLEKHSECAKQEASPKKKTSKARQGLVALLDSLNKQPATPERKAAKEAAVKTYRKAHPKSAERG